MYFTHDSLVRFDSFKIIVRILILLVDSLRSPGPVTPRDVDCEGFRITYTTIAGFDAKVDDSIETFLRSLSQIGPELLCGGLTLSFFERRASRQLFGLVSHEERVM